MEKAASLSSSPINIIQAIAAKALNFKLKNSSAHKNEATTINEEQSNSTEPDCIDENKSTSKKTPREIESLYSFIQWEWGKINALIIFYYLYI